MPERVGVADWALAEGYVDEGPRRGVREQERRQHGGREDARGDGYYGSSAYDFNRPRDEELRGGLTGQDRVDWLRWMNDRESASDVAEAQARMEARQIWEDLRKLDEEPEHQYRRKDGFSPLSNNSAERGSRYDRSRYYQRDSMKAASTSGNDSTRKHGSRKDDKGSGQYVKIEIKVPIGQNQKADTKTRRAIKDETGGSTRDSSARYSQYRAQHDPWATEGYRSRGDSLLYGFPSQNPIDAGQGRSSRHPQALAPVFEEEMNPAQVQGGNAGQGFPPQQPPPVNGGNFNMPIRSRSGASHRHQQSQNPGRQPREVVYRGPRDSPWGYPSPEEMARRSSGQGMGQQAPAVDGSRERQQSREGSKKGGGKIRAEKYTKALGWLAGG